MWCCLLGTITAGNSVTGVLSAAQAVVPGGRQPVRQDREGLSARHADAASHPDALTLIVVALAEPPSVADDGVVTAHGALPRQAVQRDHPGSILSWASGSAIKRITAGVKAAADRPCQVSI